MTRKYPNLRRVMGVFFRADMEKLMGEYECEASLTWKEGKCELTIWSGDSSGYTESWVADNWAELDELVKRNPAGM